MEYIGDIPHLTNQLDINLQRDLQIDFTWRYISWMIMPLIGPPLYNGGRCKQMSMVTQTCP